MADGTSDMISNVPDELVIAVITLLSFVEAYKFCLLKRKWRENALWLHSTCLELHGINFFYAKARQSWLNIGRRVKSMELKLIGKMKYYDFVDNIITNSEAKELSKLSFRMQYSTQYQKNIDNWIRIALEKQVKELSLDFSDGDPLEPEPIQLSPQYVLTQEFYQNAESIRVFSLNSCGLGFCNFSKFVSLKSLSLTRVHILWMEVLHLARCCNLLESLTIVECYRLIKLEIAFNLVNLRKLVVKRCEPLLLGFDLSVPRLEYFEYEGKPVPFNMRNVDRLEEVMLEYQMDPYFPYDEMDLRHLFNGFFGAKIIKLSTSFLKIFPVEYLLYGQSLFRLLNVQHLQMRSCLERYEIPAILFLLRNSPQVKKISITSTGFTRQTQFQEIMHQSYPSLPEEVWKVQGWNLNNLELMELDGYTGRKSEIEFLKLIIRNSMSLRLLTVKPWVGGSTSSADSQAMDHLKAVALASGATEIKWL